ncbi:MAG: HAD family hydrolase [Candidatus Hodarchaeota archaeon]
MKQLRAIIFDFDDTLIYSRIPWPEIKHKSAVMMAKTGISVSKAHEFSMKELLDMAKKHQTALYKKLWTLVEDYENRCALTAEIDPETPKILKTLAQQFQLGIVTNNATRNTHVILERFNIRKNFQIVLTREDFSRTKPEPEGLLLSVKRLGVTKEECVYVGDSWVDGQAATRAGIKFIGLNLKETKRKSENYHCWKSIKHLRELLTILTDKKALLD